MEQATPPDRPATWFGHPRGVSTLFFTEMWERFSYYGMRAFLILYMTAPAAAGGLAFTEKLAGRIYGLYTGSAWMAAIVGGLVADRLLGHFRSVLAGGILIALGHFTLAFPSLSFFYSGLALIVLGTGLLKPNVSILVGSLYGPEDQRRDAGFSLFFMGINLGATLGPLIAGYLAQKVNWHLGFACAGVGMAFGLVQYVAGRRHLQPAVEGSKPRTTESERPSEQRSTFFGFTPTEWKRLAAVVLLFLFACIFFGAYEQAGSTLNLFADRYVRLSVLGFRFPSSWFQSVPSAFVILLAPILAWLWMRLGPREPSSPAKFVLGLLFIGLSFLLLVPGASAAQGGEGLRISPLWLVGVYFLQELGELSLSPIGLSVVTKLAPRRVAGLMMGVWFLSIAVGDVIAGATAGFFRTIPLNTLFLIVGAVAIGAGFVLLILVRPIRRLMGGVH
jgi:POT family proton-dependent oligopeptide transporter